MKYFKGTLVTGDFTDNTMTFQIGGDMVLQAGEYLIISKDEIHRRIVQLEEEVRMPTEVHHFDEAIELDGRYSKQNGITGRVMAAKEVEILKRFA